MASTTDLRAAQPGDGAASASGKLQTWGYHNTFATHTSAVPATNPPSYEKAIARPSCDVSQNVGSEPLPGYSCEVHLEGFLDMRTELSSPFLISLDNDWHKVFVVLHGTQLSIYKLKRSLFKSRAEKQGKLLRTYSLQHAEIGIAVDWIKGDLIPKATFARVLPKHSQQRLYESDPELFEPIREFVFRLRVEQEQLIFCAPSHSEMLDWVEEVCVGIDISPPLDDRHEPRYRSLPRRTRRQRQIENAAQQGPESRNQEETERQIIAEQEAIFRRLYPNLANPSSTEQAAPEETPIERTETERETPNEPADNNEFDREDVLGESADVSLASQTTSQSLPEEDEIILYDPKTAAPRAPMNYNALCRFRRRCAPILLASSPRASHIIFASGTRYQIDGRRCQLIPFVTRPPRYDTHERIAVPVPQRPVLERGVTATSQWSNGFSDVEGEGEADSMHSLQEELDRIDTVGSTSERMLTAKGKARALLNGKISSTPLKKSVSRSYEADIIAFAPVLV